MNAEAPAVSVAGLRHAYGDRPALRGVSFDVAPGERFAILGPNGGGKTTLFRILSTLMPPAGGTARIGGADVREDPDRVRASLGVVFQSPSLDRKLTVEENLVHQGHLYGLAGAPLRERARDLLGRFGLADRARERAEALSGGQRRRVELAKCLLHRPRVLLMDEPSTGLDPGARRDLRDQLEDLRKSDGVTVLLTTHLMEEAERCDRVVVLDRGSVVATGAPDDLRAAIRGDVVLLEAAEPEGLRDEIRARWGAEGTVVDGRVRVEIAAGHEFVVKVVEAFPGRIRSATFGRPTLEDVFVHHTGRRMGDG